MNLLIKLLLAVAPFLLSLVIVWLVAEGYVDLGRGDKDILIGLPLLAWSFLYLCAYVVLWWRGASLGRSLALSAGGATGFLVFAWLVLYAVVS